MAIFIQISMTKLLFDGSYEILKEEVFYMCIVRAGCIRTWSNLQIAGEDDLTVSTIVGGINLHLDPSN